MSSLERFSELFGASGHPQIKVSYNIAPGSQLLVARASNNGDRELTTLKWGLVPAWSDAPKTPYSTINARAETVASKPSFRSAFRHRRCLVAADGFYEWHPRPDGHKQPYFIQLQPETPFAFAGIWEYWEREGTILETCSIIVTEANALMQPIHERMPVILPPESYETWMNPATAAAQLQALLTPYPAQGMKKHPVKTSVNNPRNDGRDLIEPA